MDKPISILNINKLAIFIFIAFLPFLSFSQKKKNEKRRKILGTQTVFAVTYSPILPFSLIQNNDRTKTTDSSYYNVKNLFGYEFGMEIRHDFTKYFSLQTGINFIRRNFDATAEISTSNLSVAEKLKFIAYEIPVKGLGFVRLSENIYMNLGAGFGVEMFPSDIYINHFYGQRRSWIQLPLLANVGWEFRSKMSGIFYIGASYKLHFNNMAYIVFTNDYGRRIDYIDISGNYLSINLKYYFSKK